MQGAQFSIRTDNPASPLSGGSSGSVSLNNYQFSFGQDGIIAAVSGMGGTVSVSQGSIGEPPAGYVVDFPPINADPINLPQGFDPDGTPQLAITAQDMADADGNPVTAVCECLRRNEWTETE